MRSPLRAHSAAGWLWGKGVGVGLSLGPRRGGAPLALVTEENGAEPACWLAGEPALSHLPPGLGLAGTGRGGWEAEKVRLRCF